MIPYFIAAHPGSRDEDMVQLALWLKRNDLRVDQVQTFYPSPMALATAMYHSERNPLHKLSYKSEQVLVPRGFDQRRLQKAVLRYHDPAHADRIREALTTMGRRDLIGTGEGCLVPEAPPARGLGGSRTARSGKMGGAGSNRRQSSPSGRSGRRHR